jgi:hypothetical protein
VNVMSWSPPPVSLAADAVEEWVVASSGGLITKVEAIDRATQQRTDVSAFFWVLPSNGGTGQTEESVVTTNNRLITKIEKIDRATQQRTELSRDEYAGLVAVMGLAAYHAGIRDYASALATGDTNAAQMYYKAMTDYFATMGWS